MARDLTGKIVLVTGSADGLGLSMVENFLANGVQLAIMLDINETQGLQSLEKIKTKYGNDRAVFFKCNVTTDLEIVYEQVMSVAKKVDIIVNNAGILDEKNIKNTINVNTIAVMEWSMKFFEHMRKDKGGNGGTIINISSIFGYRVIPFIPYYHASKFAVIGFSKSLGHVYTFSKTGVRVVTLCPGLTRTSLTDNADVREKDTFEDFMDVAHKSEWQEVGDIGRGIVEIFQKADSGSVWLVEGGRPAEKINV